MATAAWDAGNRHGLPEELELDYAAYAKARDEGLAGQAAAFLKEAEAILETLTGHPKADEARKFIEANKENPVALAKGINRLRALAAEKQEVVS